MKSRSLLKKFIFSLALAVGLALGTAAVCSFADTVTVGDYTYTYTTSGSDCIVIGVTPAPSGNYVMPTTLNERTIIRVGDETFQGNTNLTSVKLPANLTWLQSKVFSGCTNLRSVTIPDSVKRIGFNTFLNCVNLESVTLPASLIKMERDTFRGCTKLQSITVPSNLTDVGARSFYGCTGLRNVTILNGVVGESWFEGCTSLDTVIFSDYGTSIGSNAFKNCTNLKYVAIPYPSGAGTIASNAFTGCENLSLFIDESWSYYNTTTNTTTFTLDIPSTAKIYRCSTTWNIHKDSNGIILDGDIQIKNIDNLSGFTGTVEIPIKVGVYEVTSIKNVFGSCTGLTDLIVPKSASGYSSLTLPSGSCLWPYELSGDGVSLTAAKNKNKYTASNSSVTIPTTVMELPVVELNGTFSDSTSFSVVKSVTIPSTVTTLTGSVFEGTAITSLTIPASVTTIENKLLSLSTVAGMFPATLKSIEVSSSNNVFSSEDGVLYNKNKTTLIYCPIKLNVTSWDTRFLVPDGVETIENLAFYGNTTIKTLTLPTSITTLGVGALRFGDKLFDSDETNSPSFQCKVFLQDISINFPTVTFSGDITFNDYISCISNTVEVFRYSVIDEGTQNTVPDNKTLVKITKGNIRNNTTSNISSNLACISMGCSVGGKYIIGSVNSPVVFNTEGFKTGGTTANVTVDFPHSSSPAVVHVDEKSATCIEPGCVGGYTCNYCRRHFEDSALTTAIPLADWEIAALGHLLTEHQEKAATCSATGNVHYWSCGRSACLKNFSDAGATTEISNVTTAINPEAHNWGTPGYTWQTQSSNNTLNGSVNYVCTHNIEHTKSDPVELTVYSGIYDRNEHTGVTISSNPTEKKIEFSQDNEATWDEDIPIYTDAGTYNLSVRFAGQTSNYGTATVTISKKDISTATLTISFNGIPIYNGLVQVPDNISFALSGNTYIVKGSV